MAVERISPEVARRRIQADDATLVCAYDSDEKFQKNRLEGAISLDEFRDRLPNLPKTRELIFYCA